MRKTAVLRGACAFVVAGMTPMVWGGYEVPNPAYAPPTHYYDAAAGTGLTLRANLHNIISTGFTMRSYGDSRYSMATEYSNGTSKTSSDQDTNSANNIILMYNRASIPGVWDAGATWNREHVWPKNWLDVTSSQVDNTYKGPASDLFELRPSNPGINSSRSDDGFGYYPSTLSSYGHISSYWYPGTADTGDVARTIFYMATRYFNPSNSQRGTDIQNLDIKNGTPTKFNMGDLNSLLHWNYSDGVDNFERARNQYIYGSSGDLTNHALNPSYYQGNRNPFIDHPEYVWAIFGGGNNNSRIYVGSSSNTDGSSTATVDLGRAIVGSTLPTGSVTVNKTGANPTTFDITASGVTTPAASALQIGAGQPFDYNNVTKTMTVALTASTSTAGVKTGSVTLNNTDLTTGGTGLGSADGNDTVTVTATVVDHSIGSFAAGSTLTAQTLDFGYVPQGFAGRSASFSIANRPATSGYTADLALNSISSSGSGSFGVNTATFTHLSAGSQNNYTATLSTTTPGALSATRTFNVSDEVIPGATAGAPLGLTMTARVLSSATFPATGFIQLNSGETYNTGAFSIASGVTLTKSGPGAMNVTGTQSNGAGSTLAIIGGAVSFSTDAGSAANFPLAVSTANTGSALTFASAQHLAGLNITDNTTATLSPGGSNLLVSKGLTVTSLGRLDLNDNDAIVTASSETIRGYLLTGWSSGTWNGHGIISTAAANDSSHTTGIGYVPASLLGGTFDGETLDPNAIVLRYTTYGDANLDGTITADDFSLADKGMAGQLTGWVYGDFDYSGTIDVTDYLLLDESYGRQQGLLSPDLLADRQARFGSDYVTALVTSVPEPSAAGVVVASMLLLRRRRVSPSRPAQAR